MPWNLSGSVTVQQGQRVRISGPLTPGSVIAVVNVGFGSPSGNITFVLSRETPLFPPALDGESILLVEAVARGRAVALGIPQAPWQEVVWMYHVRNSRLPSELFNVYLFTQ